MPTFFPTARIYKNQIYKLKVNPKTYPFSDEYAKKNRADDLWTLQEAEQICNGYEAKLLDKGPIGRMPISDQNMEHWYVVMKMREGPRKDEIVFIAFDWIDFSEACTCSISTLMTQGCVEKK